MVEGKRSYRVAVEIEMQIDYRALSVAGRVNSNLKYNYGCDEWR
ncbi:MAG: hypothetical protein WCS96_04085 [Victivallales bacterium]